MIDIHCLIHPGYNQEYYSQIKRQIDQEPKVIFHEVWNEKSISEGRALAYTLGDCPYVGFVDSDDLIQPGIFQKILEEFENGAEVVTCNEMLLIEKEKMIMPGLLMRPDLYTDWLQNLFPHPNINHHIFCFRRELLNPDYVEDSLGKMGESIIQFGDYTYAAVSDVEKRKAVLIPEAGYYYRRHDNQVTAWIEGVITGTESLTLP